MYYCRGQSINPPVAVVTFHILINQSSSIELLICLISISTSFLILVNPIIEKIIYEIVVSVCND